MQRVNNISQVDADKQMLENSKAINELFRTHDVDDFEKIAVRKNTGKPIHKFFRLRMSRSQNNKRCYTCERQADECAASVDRANRSDAELQKSKSRLAPIQSELQKSNDTNNAMRVELNELDSTILRLQLQLAPAKALQEDVKKCKQELAACEGELTKSRADLVSCKSESDKSAADLRRDLAAQKLAQDNAIKQRDAQLLAAQTEAKNARDAQQKVAGELQKFQAEYAALQTKYAATQAQPEAAKTE